jgi:hypothetical protein
MLPLIVIALAIVFLVLLKSGLLDDLAETVLRKKAGAGGWHPEELEEPAPDLEMDERLEVFRDFFEGESDEDNG